MSGTIYWQFPQGSPPTGSERIGPIRQNGADVSLTLAEAGFGNVFSNPQVFDGTDYASLQLVFRTVAALKAFNPTALLSTAQLSASVAGNAAPGDGLGGVFDWITGSTAADNGVFLFQSTSYSGTGRWQRRVPLAPPGPPERLTPATGQVLSLASLNAWHLLNPAGTLASLTITMPPIVQGGSVHRISCTQAITDLTVQPSAGQSLDGNPGGLAANASLEWGYDDASATWTRII